MCECLLTTSPVSVGPLQRLGSGTITDAPVCQLISSVKDNKLKEKEMSTVIGKGEGLREEEEEEKTKKEKKHGGMLEGEKRRRK